MKMARPCAKAVSYLADLPTTFDGHPSNRLARNTVIVDYQNVRLMSH